MSSFSLSLEEQEHQLAAVRSVLAALNGVEPKEGPSYANPELTSTDLEIIRQNIEDVQHGRIDGVSAIPFETRSRSKDGPLGIDVKMETGTGKTYTYTRLMLELNRQYGFHKFILLVPTAPIRAGAASFITSDYTDEHFKMIFGDTTIRLEVLSPIKNKKKGRSSLPAALSNYLSDNMFANQQVDALLMTGSMLVSPTMKNATDQLALGKFSQPYDGLAATRPIVIIDEPHRFRRDQQQYKTVVEKLNPLAVIRFGATFPRETVGSGKKKTTVIDYNNLVYDLNAAQSFNRGLVKGVAVQIPADLQGESYRLKLTNVTVRPKLAIFRDEVNRGVYELKEGDSLGDVHPDFSGLAIRRIGKSDDSGQNCVQLTNDLEIFKSGILSSTVFSKSYQDAMIETALYNHFEKEWDNYNKHIRIKTVTLFFIDSVESYRQDDNSPGHLQLDFEKRLKAHLIKNIELHSSDSSERAQQYVSYLRFSLANLKATHGGYFSKDNGAADEAVKAEVEAILGDKQKLMSFEGPDGVPNIFRFVFSKWTLREGWDAPNVFQIAKLRSSGSEVSKLQEVGRGLRIPVDEHGNRVKGEDFYLTYLIDSSEADFGRKLVAEINSSVVRLTNVLPLLEEVADSIGGNVTAKQLFKDLLEKDFVEVDGEVNPTKEDDFYAEYPAFYQGLRDGKVIVLDPDNGSGKRKPRPKNHVGIRKHNFELLRELWEAINARYIVKMDEVDRGSLDDAMDYIMEADPYRSRRRDIHQQTLTRDGGLVRISEKTAHSHVVTDTLPYGVFLRRFAEFSRFPVSVIHAGLIHANEQRPLEDDFFNPDTLAAMQSLFLNWFTKEFDSQFTYQKVPMKSKETKLTAPDGTVRDSVVQGTVGTTLASDVEVPDNFLFDRVVYDSDLELKNTISSTSQAVPSVKVFGKIPRRSIRIPTIYGGTTSPDFMYLLQRGDRRSVHFIVETKDVDSDASLRNEEKCKIAAAETFFAAVGENSEADADVVFRSQLNTNEIKSLIDSVLKKQ